MSDHPAPSPTGTDPTCPQVAHAPIPELAALGQRMTAARQALGLDLKDLADRLCIGHEQLQALESANTSHLPELVFVIAQVRRVAASLGLDAEEAVTALRAIAPARSPEANSPTARQRRASTAPPGRSPIPARSRAKEGKGIMPAGGQLACIGLLLTAAAVGLAVLWQRGASDPDPQSTGQASSGSPRPGSGVIPTARISP